MVARKSKMTRKMRKNKRRGHSRRRHSGGMSPVNDTSMKMPQANSLAQGGQFANMHKSQHGGAAPYPAGVTDSVLSGSMVDSARVAPLNTAIAQIQGMQDGGRKFRKTRGLKGKKGKKASRSQRRKHRGGAVMNGSPLSADSMLLPSGLEKQAGLNYDWDAARNPNYWAPKQ